jgi:hypothetical protein
MSKSLQYYMQKETDIRLSGNIEFHLMDKIIEKFKKKHIQEGVEATLLFSYSDTNIYSFYIKYKTLLNNIEASFTIDKKKKNVIRVNIKDKNKELPLNNEERIEIKYIYDYFRHDIKKILRQKEVIFKIIDDFQLYLNKERKLNRHLEKYNKLISFKRQENNISNFNKIFKKEKVSNIHNYIDKYYQNTDETKIYKTINFMSVIYGTFEFIFIPEEIKIFNYKKENEYYVYNSKLITKSQLLKILDKYLMYKNKIIKNLDDIPFDEGESNRACKYELVSAFVNKILLAKNIKGF